MTNKGAALLAIGLSTLMWSACKPSLPVQESFTNSIGMEFVRIEPGEFLMGSPDEPFPEELITVTTIRQGRDVREYLRNGCPDELPQGPVRITRRFYMGVYEVTNEQYERFDPGHRRLRGKLDFSKQDDEAVVFVSWENARAFCEWLSEKEGRPYRLPTEAEWEYACRAGTTSYFHTGDQLPESFLRNPRESAYPCTGRSIPEDVVSLVVGMTPANLWGLHEMHGGVEEWCLDWYGPYPSGPRSDPVGPASGEFRVLRGGSHSTPSFYLRSANRMGSVPDDSSWMIGFRVVLGEFPDSPPGNAARDRPRHQVDVRQDVPADLEVGPDPNRPYFRGPRQYIKISEGAIGPLFYLHNHCPTIIQCFNGDLLATWFTTWTESGREMAVAASRLRYGEEEWDPASIFWAPPDRNVSTSTLWVDRENRRIVNFSSLATAEAAPSIVMRWSNDNGASWSRPETIVEHGNRNQVMETVFRDRMGGIVLPVDAVRDGRTSVYLSLDDGRTWEDLGGWEEGKRIAGIHAPIVELVNGDWLAFGRYDDIDGRMPKSLSGDRGKSWSSSASEFQPIGGGRRMTMMRLTEGPIFFASFCRDMPIRDVTGEVRKVSGLFAALSYDEGETWPVRRLVTDDGPGRDVIGRKNNSFRMSLNEAEPNGYLSSCQSADGIIHLVSNRVHYSFNRKWLETSPPGR